MFYQPLEQQYQYQQEQEQQRREFEIYRQQFIQQVLLSTPPPSPMATALGHPNRSCASCKKRKVKCDRKTPSCTACQKSKHRCQYTSYSPPAELQQHDDDEYKVIRQRYEQLQRMLPDMKVQPTMVPKDGYANNPNFYNLEDEDTFLNMNLANPMMQATQFAIPQGSPHVSQQSSPQQLSPQPIQISAQPYILQNTTDTPFIQTNLSQESCSPYMRGTITLNYNLNGMRPLLGRNILPYLERMTMGQGPILPSTGFNDVVHLQNWLREKFICQEWTEEMDHDERFELRYLSEEVNPQQFSMRQRFEVILHRMETVSSPISVQEEFQGYEIEDKHNMDMENYTTYSETGSNRSSIVDIDSTDIFLNKIYAFVRRFIRNHPWLRENFLMSLRAQSLIPMGFDASFNDGVFSDVSVEVRKIYSYSPYQDLKIIQNNHEELVKGRMLLY